MSKVSILLITHKEIGTALLNATATTFGKLPLSATTVAINYDAKPELILPQLKQLVKKLDQGKGVLILTDLYGSTPSNLAQRLQDEAHVKVIAGLNLPMLIRVMNYPDLDLAQLCHKALSGGRDGVLVSEIPSYMLKQSTSRSDELIKA